MSYFYCEKCGELVCENEEGCTQGCEHHPLKEKKNMRKILAELWLKFLILIGFRSKCCGAKIFDDEASGYSHANRYCSKCNKQIS